VTAPKHVGAVLMSILMYILKLFLRQSTRGSVGDKKTDNIKMHVRYVEKKMLPPLMMMMMMMPMMRRDEYKIYGYTLEIWREPKDKNPSSSTDSRSAGQGMSLLKIQYLVQ
jgi:hypothetical protein